MKYTLEIYFKKLNINTSFLLGTASYSLSKTFFKSFGSPSSFYLAVHPMYSRDNYHAMIVHTCLSTPQHLY